MRDGHGGVTIGSEISGGCWNVFAHDCRMDSPRLDRALRLKNNAMRGGVLRDIYMRDVTVGQVADSVLSIDFFYEEGDKGRSRRSRATSRSGTSRAEKSPYGALSPRLPERADRAVRVIDCHFENVAKGNVIEHVNGLDTAGTTINGAPVREARALAVAGVAARPAPRRRRPPPRFGSRRFDGHGPYESPNLSCARSPSVVYDKWDYTAGLVLLAMERVGATTHDRELPDLREAERRFLVGADGHRFAPTTAATSTSIRSTKAVSLFALTDETHDPRYMKRRRRAPRRNCRMQPRTAEGGFWHKQIYPEQMWLDGLYMAEPFYAEYAARHADTAAMNDVARQFFLSRRHLRDPKTGLYYHAWDSAHSSHGPIRSTGLSKNFWGRAVGWYLMAAIDVLDYLPTNHRDRPALIRIVQQLADAVARVQDPDAACGGRCSTNRTGRETISRHRLGDVHLLIRQRRANGLSRARSTTHSPTRAFDGMLRQFVTTDADGLVSIRRSARSRASAAIRRATARTSTT